MLKLYTLTVMFASDEVVVNGENEFLFIGYHTSSEERQKLVNLLHGFDKPDEEGDGFSPEAIELLDRVGYRVHDYTLIKWEDEAEFEASDEFWATVRAYVLGMFTGVHFKKPENEDEAET